MTRHENYIMRKEVEYVLGLTTNWITRKFFLFSSFTNGYFKMYQRPVFNLFCVSLVVVLALIDKAEAKIGIVQIIFAIMMFLSITSRPYRDIHSNVLNIILNVMINQVVFEINLKMAGLSYSLMVDKYFHYM